MQQIKCSYSKCQDSLAVPSLNDFAQVKEAADTAGWSLIVTSNGVLLACGNEHALKWVEEAQAQAAQAGE